MNHVCSVSECGKWVPYPYTKSHLRFHRGETRSQRQPNQVEDLSVRLLRQFRAGERRAAKAIRKTIGTIQPAMKAVVPDPVVPVEKPVMEKKHPIREFFTRLFRGRKS